jgi:hypothetical protein
VSISELRNPGCASLTSHTAQCPWVIEELAVASVLTELCAATSFDTFQPWGVAIGVAQVDALNRDGVGLDVGYIRGKCRIYSGARIASRERVQGVEIGSRAGQC